uniref:RB113 n=1 Tax=Ruegeria sp. PR1b TaxID=185588 RepID=Q8KWC9_9RHOB|nr:hypothetical protein [Ruegeria sp. PR1b]AAN05134.1 RB113 [Ruegeria sp. PR1b]
MKQIIIHCGMPKTGSSALQVQLAQSRDTLLAYGYDYLNHGDVEQARQGRITSGNGAQLARAYLNPEHPAGLADQRADITATFRKMIAATEAHVILSSEFFSATPRPLLAELCAALQDLGQVVLVFFVREQLNAIASTYIQQVKRHMLTQYPDEYLADWSRYKIPMMYHSYLSNLAKRAPEALLLSKPYELSQTHPAGLMGLFMEMIGAEIPQEKLPEDSRINLSPGPQEIRLMLEINKHHPRMQFSDMLVEGSFASGRSNIHNQHSLLPPALSAEIRAFFQAENDAYFKTFAQCDNIYAKLSETEDAIDLRAVSFDATSVVEILSGLLSRMDRRLARLEEKLS